MKFLVAILLMTTSMFSFAEEKVKATTEPTGKIFFVSPKDGDTVGQSFVVKLGLEGLKLAPSGKKDAGTGHHTIVIKGGWISSGSVVPKDPDHIHLDKGESEATIKLAPGEYTLTLQFTDGSNNSYGQALSQTIKVKVK